MARKKKVIRVALGKVQEIAKAHRCSQTSVYNALAYSTESELAKLIRKEAKEIYGGVETTQVVFE